MTEAKVAWYDAMRARDKAEANLTRQCMRFGQSLVWERKTEAKFMKKQDELLHMERRMGL